MCKLWVCNQFFSKKSILGRFFLAIHPYINIMYDAPQVRCAGFELRYKGGRVLDGISATQHLSQQPPCCLGQQLSWSETATNNFNNFNNTNNTTITIIKIILLDAIKNFLTSIFLWCDGEFSPIFSSISFCYICTPWPTAK